MFDFILRMHRSEACGRRLMPGFEMSITVVDLQTEIFPFTLQIYDIIQYAFFLIISNEIPLIEK